MIEAVRGGTTRHLLDVVRWAPGVDHHVVVAPAGAVAASSGAGYDVAAVNAMREAGARVYEVDMRRFPAHPANGLAALRLRNLARRVKPDVLHGHSSVGGALARVVAAGTGHPVLYTPNGFAPGRLAQTTERLLAPLTTRLVAVSPSEAVEARRLLTRRPARVVTVANGIDLQATFPPMDVRAELGLAPDVPLVGTVARLVPQKAPELAVAACAAVAEQRADVHFVLVGLGPLQADVDAAVARAGLGDRWHHIPQLPQAAALIAGLDVFILPSRFEGGPYTPLEAMRAGTPVVLSDVVGNRDAVEDGVSGILVPFGDSDAMAAGVLRLLQDQPLRDGMVAAAHERLRSRFDVRAMGAALGALYAEVVAGSARTSRSAPEAPGARRRSRKLPHPKASSSTQSPESRAAQNNS